MERLDLWRVGVVAPNPLVAQADQGRVAVGNRAPWPLAEMDCPVIFMPVVEVVVVTMAVVAGEKTLTLKGLVA